MFRHLLELLTPYRRIFVDFCLLLLLYEGLQIIEGYTTSLIVRLYSEETRGIVWVFLLLGLVIFDELFMRLDNKLDMHVITKHLYPIYKHLKLGAIRKFLELDVPWHQAHNSGALVGKVGNGVWKVQEIVDSLSWEFVPTLVQASLSLIPILILSPLVGVISIASFTLFMYLSIRSTRRRRPYKSLRHDLYEREWHHAIEIVQSVETSTMFGQKNRLLIEQTELHDRIIKTGVEEAHLGIYHYNRWRIRILFIARRAVLVTWIFQLYSGTLDIANLIFLSVLTEKLFYSFWRFARLLDRAAEATEGTERLHQLFSEKTKTKQDGTRRELTGPVGITLQNVCFSYQENYTPDALGALHNLTLEIPPGEIVALVGPSGAGKTTIRKIVTGLMPIQSGHVVVGGVDVSGWHPEALLSLFSYVPQGDEVFIFAGTIYDNIVFPRPTSSCAEVVEASTLAGIHQFIESLPDSYDTLVGERGKRLSGGQKQRIALARAILANRPILILDEATSAVDAITEHEIQSRMAEILTDKTAIIIAHRLSTVWEIADRIAVLDKGRLVDQGTHQQLLVTCPLYRDMVRLQTTQS